MSGVSDTRARRAIKRPAAPRAVADPPGTDARRHALALLDSVVRKGLPLELGATAREARSDDRALALAIAAETLRHLPDLDALIDSATARPLPADAKARAVLRIALAQMLALGTPPHAAIATALPLVEGGPRRLVHGVLGTLVRGRVQLPPFVALPAEVAERWHHWGEEVLAAASRLLAAPPPLDLAFATDKPPPAQGASLLPGHLRLPRGTAVTDLPGYADGGWWVQDVAASVPARLFGPAAGRHILDLCAAPGGKTMQLAAAGFRVTAVDQAAARLERLQANLARTGLASDLIAADLFRWTPPAPVDAILLDAPCSATGTFRRHPDVLHRVRAAALPALAEAQSAMLRRAADWLRPGGTLVYAVCSLEREEGEAVAARFLAERVDYRTDRVAPDELPPLAATPEGWLRLLPGLWEEAGGADSFFIARFTRSGA